MTSKVEQINWKQSLVQFLANYRTTPYCTTNVAPAQVMFANRTFSTRVPEIPVILEDRCIRHKDKLNKYKMKKYAEIHSKIRRNEIKVGDTVLVKNSRNAKSDPYYDPVPYVVISKNGTMVTASHENRRITRNSMWFKVIIQKKA